MKYERTEELLSSGQSSKAPNKKPIKIIVITLGVLLIGGIGLGGFYFMQQHQVATLESDGEQALLDKDYDKAEDLFKKILGKDASNINAYEKLGEVCIAQKKYDDAIDILDKGEEKAKEKSDQTYIYKKLATAYTGAKKSESDLKKLYADAYKKTEDNYFKTYDASKVGNGDSSNTALKEQTKHRYELFISDTSWTEAQKICKGKGGYLVTFDSEDEWNQVQTQIQNSGYDNKKFYIGGSRTAEGKEYKWLDKDGNYYGNSLNTSTHWIPGDPSYYDGNAEGDAVNEMYMMIYYYNTGGYWAWADVPNNVPQAVPSYSGKVGYICEYDK